MDDEEKGKSEEQQDTDTGSEKKTEDDEEEKSKNGARCSSNKKASAQQGSKGSASDALEMALADIGWNNNDMEDDLGNYSGIEARFLNPMSANTAAFVDCT